MRNPDAVGIAVSIDSSVPRSAPLRAKGFFGMTAWRGGALTAWGVFWGCSLSAFFVMGCGVFSGVFSGYLNAPSEGLADQGKIFRFFS